MLGCSGHWTRGCRVSPLLGTIHLCRLFLTFKALQWPHKVAYCRTHVALSGYFQWSASEVGLCQRQFRRDTSLKVSLNLHDIKIAELINFLNNVFLALFEPSKCRFWHCSDLNKDSHKKKLLKSHAELELWISPFILTGCGLVNPKYLP